jgi:hypothetical protein
MELAETKAALERRLAELERRLEVLKLALALVEEELERGSAAGQRGGAACVALSQSAPQAAGAAEGSELGKLGSKLGEEVLVWGGAGLARFAAYERGLAVEPLVEVPAGSPHLLNTLVLKVLNEYRREDALAALRGGLRYGERLSYTIAEEADLVERIAARNWRGKAGGGPGSRSAGAQQGPAAKPSAAVAAGPQRSSSRDLPRASASRVSMECPNTPLQR